MTLIGAILNKVKSKDSIAQKKYASPPPELDETFIERTISKKKKKVVYAYSHVVARVDSSPPRLQPKYMFRHLAGWMNRLSKIYKENVKLVLEIKRQHFLRGKVDCHWDQPIKPVTRYYDKRWDFLRKVQAENKIIYERIIANSKPRVTPTASLEEEWRNCRRQIVAMSTRPFVLYPLSPQQIDSLFLPPPGVKRPRVQICLRVEGGASAGVLTVELFTEVCPRTCRLFTDLADGDAAGHGYVGTCFFRKVPHLYWSGGDVIYDNGFGCYAQAGLRAPIGAENYHFPHSMPGLLSMRMTPDNEMCGIFSITFKPLPQFDLKNVVFGRVIRPSSTYDLIRTFGSAFNTHPVVRVEWTRRRDASRWVCGRQNLRLEARRKMYRGRL